METLSFPVPDQRIAFGPIVRMADAHVAEGCVPVTLAGEEPTRHPAFPEVVEYLLRRHLPVLVLTDGRALDDLLARLEALPPGELRFLVDATADPRPELLRRLAGRVELRLEGPWTAEDVVRLVEQAALEDTRIHVRVAHEPSELPRLATALEDRRIVLAVSPEVDLGALTDAELGVLYRCRAVLP